jgi:hypothetical protein
MVNQYLTSKQLSGVPDLVLYFFIANIMVYKWLLSKLLRAKFCHKRAMKQ